MMYKFGKVFTRYHVKKTQALWEKEWNFFSQQARLVSFEVLCMACKVLKGVELTPTKFVGVGLAYCPWLPLSPLSHTIDTLSRRPKP
jgi:hypothetical protein